MTAHRFPYVEVAPSHSAASALPHMPITLNHGQQQIAASALVDSQVGSVERTIWQLKRGIHVVRSTDPS